MSILRTVRSGYAARPALVATWLVLAACKKEPNTGLPVPDDPATGRGGIDTVPAKAPTPPSEHPKPPPLGALDPKTGDQPDEVDPGIRFNDAGHEAK